MATSVWTIRGGNPYNEEPYNMRGGKDEIEEAYCEGFDEGYEEGFRKAMREAEKEKRYQMGYRDDNANRQMSDNGKMNRRGYMGYRDDGDDDMMYNERRTRRMRDARGRYM